VKRRTDLVIILEKRMKEAGNFVNNTVALSRMTHKEAKTYDRDLNIRMLKNKKGKFFTLLPLPKSSVVACDGIAIVCVHIVTQTE
jgi:hypothetical protein